MSVRQYFKNGFREAPARFALSSRQMEIGAYEALWLEEGATFRTISGLVSAAPGGLPSELVAPERAEAAIQEVAARFHKAGMTDIDTQLLGVPGYPEKLKDARYPPRAFYFRGDWDLTSAPSIAVVGARQLSKEGEARTRRLVRHLVEDGFTIVSGLAAGTDRAAHTTALDAGGRTIAVLGTPVHKTYPRENAELQQLIAERFLLISQVPVLHYETRDWRSNRKFFPERNITMSALTDASVIVEIGESRGTYIQSKAALDQGRPLFLLNNCFGKPGIDWPERFERRGAVRVRCIDDIRTRLAAISTRC